MLINKVNLIEKKWLNLRLDNLTRDIAFELVMFRVMRNLFHKAICAEIDLTRSALPPGAQDLFDGAIDASTRDPWMLQSSGAAVQYLIN